MIETVRAQATLSDPRGLAHRLSAEGWFMKSLGNGSCVLQPPRNVLPEGLGYLGVVLTPGDAYVQAEGNLTALVHGPDFTAGSLAGSEIRPAFDAFVQAVRSVFPPAPAHLFRWETTRFDPSRTLALPDGFTPRDVVDAALEAWPVRIKGKTSLSPHHSVSGSTATLLNAHSGVSWSVYDKTGEALSSGKPAADRSVRVEARVKPGKPQSRPSFDDSEVLMAQSMMTLGELIDSLGSVASTGVKGMVRTLVQGQLALGESADYAEACRLAGPALVYASDGRVGLVDLGLGRQQTYRIGARISELLVASGERSDRFPLSTLMESSSDVYASDLKAVRSV